MELFVSLLPAIVVLICGYYSRRLVTSLFIGVVLAAGIASNFSPIATFNLTVNSILINLELQNFRSITTFTQGWNSLILLFILFLGILVVLLQTTNSAAAYVKFMHGKVKTAKATETSSLLLSSSLFIDDYFSSLTVGSVMQPIADKKHVPRAKLAFLVDSMSGPLAILCPFSSWVAAIIGFLRENGVNATLTDTTLVHAAPSSVYFMLLPFLFYSWILIPCLWFIVRRRISFGRMQREELRAKDTKLTTIKNAKHNAKSTLADFFLPIFFLFASIIISMLYTGGWSFSNEISWIEALQQARVALALFTGGTLSLILAIAFLLIRDRVYLKQLPKIAIEGVKLMLPAIAVLFLAWTLGDILRNKLETGVHLAAIFKTFIPVTLIPGIFFLSSFLIAATIGSCWGTAAVLFPIAIPLLLSLYNIDVTTISEMPIILPTLGAILSGSSAGNHISPISDTTIMAAASCKAPLVLHVQTQLSYSLPIIAATAISFFLAPMLLDYGICITALGAIAIGIILSFSYLYWRSET